MSLTYVSFEEFPPKPCVVCKKEFIPYSPRSLTCSKPCDKQRRLEKQREYARNKKKEVENGR